MDVIRLLSWLFISLFLASCGAGGSGNSSATGTTRVTIPFAASGASGIAGGALVAATQTTVPAEVQSMTVTAKSAAGIILAGPVTATRPNLNASMTLTNANGVSFLVQAFDVYGSQIYEGTGTQNLTGVDAVVAVTEQVLLGGVAATGLPVANATVKITDANGLIITTTTDATGNYRTILPTNLAYPLLLESTQTNGTVIASMMTSLGKVHTNTISTLTVAKTLGVASYSQISSGFTNLVSTYTNTAVPVQALDDDLNASAQQVMQQLGLTQFTILGKKDPLHDPNFVADGTGLDGVMDSVRMEEKDVDGDGKGDLVLSGRTAAGTPILSVNSTATGAFVRGAGILALSGATVAGDDLGDGVKLQDTDSITVDSAGNAGKLRTTVNPKALGFSNQQINQLTSVVAESFDEAGVALSDPYNQTVIGLLMDQMLPSLQTAIGSGSVAVNEMFLDQLGGTVSSSLIGNVTNGVISPTYKIGVFIKAIAILGSTVTASTGPSPAQNIAAGGWQGL
ncbi:MAG: hypothetical protein R8J84_00720, partial [Mariprofundales bacterium]